MAASKSIALAQFVEEAAAIIIAHYKAKGARTQCGETRRARSIGGAAPVLAEQQ